jgi:hypothetical protein
VKCRGDRRGRPAVGEHIELVVLSHGQDPEKAQGHREIDEARVGVRREVEGLDRGES